MRKAKYISPDIAKTSLDISSMLMTSAGVTSNEGISGGNKDKDGSLDPAAKKNRPRGFNSPWEAWD